MTVDGDTAGDYDEDGGQGAPAEPIDLTIDSTRDARSAARSAAMAAMETTVSVMRRPGRNAMAQLAAAKQVLEVAGLGSVAEETERRTLAAVLEALKGALEPRAYREAVQAVAKLCGREPQRALPAGSGEQGENG